MTVTYDFTGRTALVTGGSAGMGEATVRGFAGAGAGVAIVDRDADAAQALADELTGKGRKAIAIVCDVSDEDQVAAAVAKTVETFGSLDMAYNNAGIMAPRADAADESAANFDRVIAVNLRPRATARDALEVRERNENPQTRRGKAMTRPYVIIHTHTAIDGNINTIDQPGFHAGSQHYQDIALTPGKQQLDIDAYLNGKTSTEDNITHYRTPAVDEDAAPVPAGDFAAAPDAEMYYVSIDPRGELAWEFNSFGYGDVPAHVVEVLTEAASNAYKDFLRRQGISYIIAGQQQVDYELMLAKLRGLGIQRLMIGGGGSINWSFVQQGLVDEISMILAPVANGDPDAPRFFTAKEPYSSIRDTEFDLTHLENLGDGVVWLRYLPKTGNEKAAS